MPKPNKYHIKAIRKQIQECIRYKSWSKFRSIFEHLESDLQTAVAKEQTGKNRQKSSPALLCVLLQHVKKTSSIPPYDLIELILKACPISTTDTTIPNFYGNVNPLSIAIDNNAPITVIELILKYDEAKELLYRTKQHPREQRPPILRAALHFYHGGTDNEQLLRLLVANDVTKQSLLAPSEKKKKVALYYVAHDFIDELPLELEKFEEDSSSDGNRDIWVAEILEFMLLQTQEAIEIQQGSRKRVADQPIGKVGRSDDDDRVGFFYFSRNVANVSESHLSNEVTHQRKDDDDDSEHGQNSNIRAMKLFRAMVTCAHLVGTRKTLDLMQHLVSRTHNLTRVDEHGESLLHCIGRATDASAFLESCLVNDEGPMKRNLVQHLIAECPNILLQKNNDGDIPLHVAIRNGKTWGFLRHLCLPIHAAAVLSTPTKQNQLPLHLAIEYYSLHNDVEPWRYDLTNKHCIILLWQMFPEAAAIMDGRHHLFPFQMVAATGVSINRSTTKLGRRSGGLPIVQHNAVSTLSKEPKDPLFDFQVSYDLLRSSPEVLQHFN
ncbi:MAG: hypothetical protein SGBAC_013425 [Bacillariaceae sp.]